MVEHMNQNPRPVHPQGPPITAPPFPGASPPSNTLDTAYEVAKTAVENIDPDSGMRAATLNAVVNVLWVVIKKYGVSSPPGPARCTTYRFLKQTTTKHEMMDLRRRAARLYNGIILSLSDSCDPRYTWRKSEEEGEKRERMEEERARKKERREAVIRFVLLFRERHSDI